MQRQLYSKYIVFPAFLFLLILLSVVINSCVDPYGGITMDAPWYMRWAQFILEGKESQAMQPDYVYSFKPQTYFYWPPVYAYTIAGVLSLTSLPVWVAIKVVNLLFVASAIAYIVYIFKEKAWLYILPLMAASVFDMLYQGWSEVLFICVSLCWFAAVKHYYHSSRSIDAFMIFFFSLLLFGCRYLGIVCALPLIWLAVYLYKKSHRKQAMVLLMVSAFFALISCTFIYINYWIKPKISFEWNPTMPEIKEFAISACLQLLRWLDWLVASPLQNYGELLATILVSCLCIFKLRSVPQNMNPKGEVHIISKAMFLFGILYLLVPLLLRFNFAIGLLHHRFFYTAWVMFVLGFLHQYESRILPFKKYIFAGVILMFLINVPLKAYYMHYYKQAPLFTAQLNKFKHKYQPIESGSAVAFANKWIEFIRPDCYSITPNEKSLKNAAQGMSEFLRLIQNHQGHVYIEVISATDARLHRYLPDIKEYMLAHQGEEFVRIK
jgi:hypothetical protein